MKHVMTLIVAVSLIVLGFAAAAAAGDVPRLRANIPFPFYAGNKLIPAGEYVFQLQALANRAAGTTVVIVNPEGAVVHVFPAIPGNNRDGSSTNLVFNRYGKSHFLAQLNDSSLQAALIRSRAEREMSIAFSNQAAGGVIIAATR